MKEGLIVQEEGWTMLTEKGLQSRKISKDSRLGESLFFCALFVDAKKQFLKEQILEIV